MRKKTSCFKKEDIFKKNYHVIKKYTSFYKFPFLPNLIICKFKDQVNQQLLATANPKFKIGYSLEPP